MLCLTILLLFHYGGNTDPRDMATLQVNTVSVMGHKHHEVVEMIRDSSHVTLTVIGKLPRNGTRGAGKCTCIHVGTCTWERRK